MVFLHSHDEDNRAFKSELLEHEMTREIALNSPLSDNHSRDTTQEITLTHSLEYTREHEMSQDITLSHDKIRVISGAMLPAITLLSNQSYLLSLEVRVISRVM